MKQMPRHKIEYFTNQTKSMELADLLVLQDVIAQELSKRLHILLDDIDRAIPIDQVLPLIELLERLSEYPTKTQLQILVRDAKKTLLVFDDRNEK